MLISGTENTIQKIQLAKDSLTQTINRATNTLTEATHKAVDSVNETVGQAKLAGQDTLQSSKYPNEITANAMNNAIGSFVQQWMNEHPLIAWLSSHPLWTVILLIFVLFLLSGLLRAIAYFFEQVWVFLLQSPLKLGRWLLGISSQSVKHIVAPKPTSLELKGEDKQERLNHILNRLEAIKQEQDVLLQEVKNILTLDKQ
jgi:hypothetical protein